MTGLQFTIRLNRLSRAQNQNIGGSREKCGSDTNLDCHVRLSVNGLSEILVNSGEKSAVATQDLQLNLFGQLELMALLKGMPANNKPPDGKQMVLL